MRPSSERQQRHLGFFESIISSRAAAPSELGLRPQEQQIKAFAALHFRGYGAVNADSAKTMIKWLEVGKEVLGLWFTEASFCGIININN